MILHDSTIYKDYVILVYQIYSNYKAVICNKNNSCFELISLHDTPYEAITFAKKRIDVGNLKF